MTDIHLLSHSFSGSETLAQFSWFLCFRVSHEAVFKMLARAGVSSVARLGDDQIPLSLMELLARFSQLLLGLGREPQFLLRYWLDTDLSSLPCSHLYGAGHNRAAGFIKVSKGKS